MAGLEIRVNADAARKHLSGIGENFRDGSSRMRLAVSRAINRTTAHMRSQISRRIRATYYVRKADLDGGIKIIKARAGKNPSGALMFAERGSLPLSNFGARQGKTYVSVKVLRANRARRIRPGGDHKILSTPKGRAAVWMAKGHVMARVEGKDSPMILYGPSFMSFFNGPGVPDSLNAEAQAFFEKRLEHEVQNVLRGGAPMFGRGR